MNRFFLAGALSLATIAGGIAAAPAIAALPKGAQAPPIITRGAIAGKAFDFTLSDALKKGPVVLYFFPKAFTQGCTLEARAFAEAMPEFKKAGATVVGMSGDDIETLKKFSTEECRDAFAVARASPATIKAYDVHLGRETGSQVLSDRTSFVIAPDGRITMVHSDMDWRKHVSLTLEAVRALDH
ncbi:peroxiredoxin [Croceicoccus mobilis]|uniref:thioredoxin-dependent peroxiredoxin n=1 Tax=Croceicoccus mobilis TaxID=1703339 RepID=A0A916Z528_9SPHN|nr:peroxiredoxin [Croceicoccus mobilis]GGD76545.1 peroxiredoxin [Croceicoccus mobilis]